MRAFAVVPALLACLAGCAAGPMYQSYRGQDAACVKGDIANIFKFFSDDGEAHVMIEEIDGVPTGGREPYCFVPGKHRIGVAATNNYQTAQDYVDLDFEAGKTYWLRANLRGISLVFQLVDVTYSPGTKVAEFSLKARDSTPPAYIPIHISVK